MNGSLPRQFVKRIKSIRILIHILFNVNKFEVELPYLIVYFKNFNLSVDEHYTNVTKGKSL